MRTSHQYAASAQFTTALNQFATYTAAKAEMREALTVEGMVEVSVLHDKAVMNLRDLESGYGNVLP
jgi:hypothetical protein